MAARKSAKSTKGLADADAAEAYNPLARINIARSIAGELLARRAIPLSDSDGIVGAGIYALYYCGDFPAYAPARNAPERLDHPSSVLQRASLRQRNRVALLHEVHENHP